MSAAPLPMKELLEKLRLRAFARRHLGYRDVRVRLDEFEALAKAAERAECAEQMRFIRSIQLGDPE